MVFICTDPWLYKSVVVHIFGFTYLWLYITIFGCTYLWLHISLVVHILVLHIFICTDLRLYIFLYRSSVVQIRRCADLWLYRFLVVYNSIHLLLYTWSYSLMMYGCVTYIPEKCQK